MKNDPKKSFVLYTDYLKHIVLLSDQEAGALFKAILIFADTGQRPELPPMAEMAFSFISAQLERDASKWKETCKKRSAAVKKRWEKEKSAGGTNDTNEYKSILSGSDTVPETDTETGTVTADESVTDTENVTNAYGGKPPAARPREKSGSRPASPEEVAAYCRERKNSVDPNRFFDYYSANGWTIGGAPMHDWKAALRSWESNAYSAQDKQSASEFDSSKYDFVINNF